MVNGRVYVPSMWRWFVRVFTVCMCLSGLFYYLWFAPNLARPEELIATNEALFKPKISSRCRQWNSTKYLCLPNAMLIGASKSGTTSAFQYLRFHPNIDHIRRRVIKRDRFNEVHRFDNAWYPYYAKSLSLAFEWASAPLMDSTNATVIHYTPHYIYAPSVPYDVRDFYPHHSKMKFVLLLRNPVQRALSSYWFKNSERFIGKDKGSIENFKKDFMEEKRIRKNYEECMAASPYIPYKKHRLLTPTERRSNFYILQNCFGKEFRSGKLGLRHIDKSIYVDQLDRWLQNFRRDQFIIISYEDWMENPLKHYERLISFLGQQLVGPRGFNSYEDLSFLNKNYLSTTNKQKTSLPPELSQELECYFRPYNERLNMLLGYEIFSTNVTGCRSHHA